MNISLLVLTPGKSEGITIPITLSQFVIGRDRHCNLRPASPLISKRHCALLRRGRKVILRDFASTNGTFVNGKPVKYDEPLKAGDVIELGPLAFSFHVGALLPIDRPTPLPTNQSTSPTDEEAAQGDLLVKSVDDSSSASIALTEESTIRNAAALVDQERTTAPIDQPKDNRDKKPVPGRTSVAAGAILDKYLKRPRS